MGSSLQWLLLLQSTGSRLPGLGIEPVFPALAGRFLSTGPPENSWMHIYQSLWSSRILESLQDFSSYLCHWFRSFASLFGSAWSFSLTWKLQEVLWSWISFTQRVTEHPLLSRFYLCNDWKLRSYFLILWLHAQLLSHVWLFCDPMVCSLKAMAPHSSTLAWKIPWTEGPGRLQSMGLLRVGHDWRTSLSLFTFRHWRRRWQPTPVFLPGESQGRWGLVGCRLWGRTESGTTEAT